MANLPSERKSPLVKSPHQHAPGLAPLEYLQLTQRRGSITDPSLHASAPQHQQAPDQSPPRHPLASSFTSHRNSSYSFPATTKMPDNAHSNTDQPPPPPRPWSAQPNHPQDQPMDTDPVNPATGRNSAGPDPARSNGTFLPPPPFAGGKRKMSHDRQGYYADEHPPNGGGYPSSYAPQDLEGPNPKRRGSTYDTNNRIAHLSLQDRRDSVDSRSSLSGLSMGGGGWAGDRRDSVYSNTSLASSVGSYSTAGPGEGKPYWSSSGQQQPLGEGHPHHSSRPFAFPPDPVGGGGGGSQQQPSSSPQHPSQHYAMPPAPPIPSVHYTASAAAARRLSIPESSLPLNGVKPRTRGGSRASKPVVRSTSSDEGVRPPSETATSETSSPLAQHSSLQAPGSQSGSRKETPYSRSPELRVSHKMAERKRRKEMKDLFDELRDQLPADRGMKASKWEILSKAVDYISQLKVAYTDMSGEIERLRGEVDTLRPGGPQVPYTQHTLVSGPSPSAPMAVSNPGPGPETPSSSQSPGMPHKSGRNGNHAGPFGERPSSAQSSNQDSLADSGGSPSAPPPPLQPHHTGSPYASHHQTPTPQQQAQPLPKSSG